MMGSKSSATLPLKFVVALGLVLGSGPLIGQGFPAASPKATLTQRLGFNEVTITYSRPRVRDRVIWGELVPWGQVWRTGADYPTFIETKAEVRVEDRLLQAGKYALYSIPTPERWTIIFSRNTELWGAFGYSPEHDELRVEVQPRSAPFTESFTIELAEVTQNRAELLLRWARLAVPVRLEVDDFDQIRSRVESAEEGDWATGWRGAEYLLETGGDLSLARRWIDQSLTVERNWMNLWTSAQIHATAGETALAVEAGRAAIEDCSENQPYCPYVGVYRRSVASWTDSSQTAP